MKLKLFIVLLLLGSLPLCKAQSLIVEEFDKRGPVQERYVAKFDPDYALFNHLGAGLIRNGGQWSLVRLRNIQGLNLNGKMQRKMHVFKRIISENYA